MVPYLLWSIIVRPFFFNTYHKTVDFSQVLTRSLIDNTSYWFLPCLFGLLVCYALYKMTRERFGLKKVWQELIIVLIIFALVAALYQVSKFDMLRSVISYYIPFWIGIFMGQYKRFNSFFTGNATIFALCLLLFCLIEGIFVGRMDIMEGKAVRLATGLLSLPIMFHLAHNLKMPTRAKAYLSTIGKDTLGIYVIHFTLIGNLPALQCDNIAIQLLICSIVSLTVTGICMMAIRILQTNIILRKYLLGTK